MTLTSVVMTMSEWNAAILDQGMRLSLVLYDVEWVDGVPVAGWVSNGGWYFRYIDGVVYLLFTRHSPLNSALSAVPTPVLNFFRYKLKPSSKSSKLYDFLDDDIPF